MPSIHLFHGADDQLVPAESSVRFAERLREAGVPVTLDVRAGINHTYPVIEGPLVRHDIQLEMILPVLVGEDAKKRLCDASSSAPMWPRFLVKLAARLSPFGAFSF